jgi:hypothetical protein
MLTEIRLPHAKPQLAAANTAAESTESMLQAATMQLAAAGSRSAVATSPASPAGSHATLQPLASSSATIGATRCRSVLS